MLESISKEHHLYKFECMASPCELHFKTKSKSEAKDLAHLGLSIAEDLEAKYSRYIPGNYWDSLHESASSIDEETFKILTFAKNAFYMSEGMFDISAGILNQVWNAKSQTLDQSKLVTLKDLVGFDKVYFDKNQIKIPSGMKLDLGGVVKEYAVDKVAQEFSKNTRSAYLINFGGDLFANKCGDNAWRVGVENANTLSPDARAIDLRHGAIATSGNSRRYFIVDGKKYGHILDPISGYPIEGAPLSVSVYADSCLEAGLVATLSMLQGRDAEAFLKANEYKYWLQK